MNGGYGDVRCNFIRQYIFIPVILCLMTLLYSGCFEAKPISREKFSANVDSLLKFQFLESQVNLKYYVLTDSLKQYHSQRNICKRIDKEIREVTAAFFRDSFYIEERPVLNYVPPDCNLDVCLPTFKFENCNYRNAFLTGYTIDTDVDNAQGLLKKLIKSDAYSSHKDRYRAKFKIHFYIEFGYEIKTNRPICEVSIDTRFFLMLQDRKNHEGKWTSKDKNDGFKIFYNATIKSLFNEKLKTDYHFLYE